MICDVTQMDQLIMTYNVLWTFRRNVILNLHILIILLRIIWYIQYQYEVFKILQSLVVKVVVETHLPKMVVCEIFTSVQISLCSCRSVCTFPACYLFPVLLQRHWLCTKSTLLFPLGRNRRSNDRYYVFKWPTASPPQRFAREIKVFVNFPWHPDLFKTFIW